MLYNVASYYFIFYKLCFTIKELTIEHLVHKNSPRIFLKFEKDAEAIQFVRNKLGA